MKPARLILPLLIAAAWPQVSFAIGGGLDSLNDDALLSELGARGLGSLMDRAFDIDHIPPSAREGQRALLSINRIADPAAGLSSQQKRQLIDQAVHGLNTSLLTVRDPRGLMKAATVLITQAIEPDVNTLEYWGDNPATQAQLRPVVETVIHMLDQAHTLATASTERFANQITSQDDKTAMARYEQSNLLAQTAEYTKNLINYDLILSMDPADPNRKTIGDQTLKFLKDFDTPDQPVRALVDLRIAKIQMVTGSWSDAHKTFATIIAGGGVNYSTPPDVQQQFEARYFDAVADVLASKPDESQHGLDSVVAWQSANLPAGSDSAKGAKAASAMLAYRIQSLRADQATSNADKATFNAQAVTTLQTLLHDQPQLQGIIFDQLMSKLPTDASMSTLDPLLLQAMMHRGEVMAVSDLPLNGSSSAMIGRAILAANELMHRPGVDPAMANNALLVVGFLQQKLGKLLDAANAFLDFTEKNARNPATFTQAQLTLNNAEAVIGKLRADSDTIDDPQVVADYERLLPLAVNEPFRQLDLTYEYARRLLKQGKPELAIAYFRLVPANDPRVLFARYYHTIAIKGVLDTLKPTDPRRPALLDQLQSLADEVRTNAQAAIDAADPKQKLAFRSMLAGTTLLAAEVSRADQKNPQRSLDLLDHFEDQIAGLPDEGQRLTDMLLIRVQADMALNHTDEATAQLVKLLARNPAEGGRLVYGVLTSLNDQLDRAEAKNDADGIRDIARNRARLTGFLVGMARTSKEPSIQKLAYGYAVFDAEVQRYAAMQETDPATKKAGLEKALDLFKKLNSPEGLAQYQKDLDARLAAKRAEKPGAMDESATDADPNQPQSPAAYDPAVLLGESRTEFDLGIWAAARSGFAQLVNEKKLGPPIRITHKNGQDVESDNDQFWEANDKLLRANFALNNPPDVDRSLTYLKTLFVRYGNRIGGKKWNGDFEKMRAEFAPDFNPDAIGKK